MEDFIHKVDFTRASGFHCVALLRLRGFLHAFHLVEMTTKREYRHLERSPVIQSVAKNLPGGAFILVKNNRLSTVISSAVERSPKAKQFYPCQVPTPYCHSERSEESPGTVNP